MEVWFLLIVPAAGIAIWIAVRERRKGDFSFRIDKLRRREAQLIAAITKLTGEIEFLDIYRGTPKEHTVKQVTDRLAEANENAVQVADRLQELRNRARSWRDFSDLYVDIGMVEEQLEKSEAALSAALAQFKKIDQRG